MPAAPPRALIFIVDGTLSRLDPGRETHAGALMKLLTEGKARSGLRVGYHPGVQGRGLRRWLSAASGLGLNEAICAGYAMLASRWRPGDRIYLFGYSRGAYAVRSLAGLIDRVGLLRRGQALERHVHRAFRLYREGDPDAAARFARRHCHPRVDVEMIGVWDTVRALGLPYPILSRLHPMATEFHDHALGGHIRNAFQALALDEDRTAFAPVLWRLPAEFPGHVEQLWFPGAHADVGGEVGRMPAARPLANLSAVWMLDRAEATGLPLPPGWRDRFPTDPTAPMLGCRRGLARFFLLRRPRRVGAFDGEDLHPSVAERLERTPWRPRAEGLAGD